MFVLFTDAQLNIGKILVLSENVNLTDEEIKRLTKASCVRKLNWEDESEDIDQFVLYAVSNAMFALNMYELGNGEVYRIDGHDATTTMLALKVGNLFKALFLDNKSIKKLHNAYLTKKIIDNARYQINCALKHHNELAEILSRQNINNGIKKKTRSFNRLIENYGDNELIVAAQTIREVLQCAW